MVWNVTAFKISTLDLLSIALDCVFALNDQLYPAIGSSS